MKTKILFTALVASVSMVLAVMPAHARSPMPNLLVSELDRFNIDETLPYADQVTAARIVINQRAKKADLRIKLGGSCPAGALCALPTFMNYELPIVAAKTDSCGTVAYLAKRDDRPVDGGLNQLIIKDNTNNRCPHFVALAPTEVIHQTAYYHRLEGKEVKTRSTFTGDRLRPVYNPSGE